MWRRRRSRSVRDHPRRCGENPRQTPRDALAWGSPPQVRGKLIVSCISAARRRITPAGAGKTASTDSTLKSPEDHPRRCGENLPFRGFLLRQMGSPPQVRGKLSFSLLHDAVRGITPAGAGKTLQAAFCGLPGKDHPRGCGENVPRLNLRALTAGSPPRMRGKLTFIGYDETATRITPADAGKTLFMKNGTVSPEDHPRGCGENSSSSLQNCALVGSPPRMRGKPSMPVPTQG